jgi:cyclohexyl-isocyanide hydratase
MDTTRRDILNALAAAAASTATAAFAQLPDAAPTTLGTANASSGRLRVVMLAYPGMTALDLVAPQLIFATLGNAEVQVVWKSTSPVKTDSGLEIVPTARLDQAASAPDVLFVPGGLKGTTAVLEDAEVVRFMRERGAQARWVTSVCTGALLLGAADLLRGYKATTHWYVRDLLPLVGATPLDERVVIDRNRVTAGGVTAGMDFALTLSARLRGEDHARRQELVFEYAPQPPFGTGTPKQAGEALTNAVLQIRRPALEAARHALTAATAPRQAS